MIVGIVILIYSSPTPCTYVHAVRFMKCLESQMVVFFDCFVTLPSFLGFFTCMDVHNYFAVRVTLLVIIVLGIIFMYSYIYLYLCSLRTYSYLMLCTIHMHRVPFIQKTAWNSEFWQSSVVQRLVSSNKFLSDLHMDSYICSPSWFCYANKLCIDDLYLYVLYL